MPLYEYECEACHRRTEKIQKFSDAPLSVCPHCGGHLERTITAAAFSFSGGGWYKDLYSSSKPAATGEGASVAGSGESGSAPAASDTSSGPTSPAPSAPAPAAAPASPAKST